MSKWWWRVPIILFCLAIVFGLLMFGKVAMAESSGDLAKILEAGLNGFKEYLDWLIEVLKLIL